MQSDPTPGRSSFIFSRISISISVLSGSVTSESIRRSCKVGYSRGYISRLIDAPARRTSGGTCPRDDWVEYLGISQLLQRNAAERREMRVLDIRGCSETTFVSHGGHTEL